MILPCLDWVYLNNFNPGTKKDTNLKPKDLLVSII
jgi:hypothetical protein